MNFQGFTQDSFDFLKELKSNNNSGWITANWARYEDLKSRIRALVQDVAETYISLKYPDLETRADSTHCMSRLNRRQANREGELHHRYLWAALYRCCFCGQRATVAFMKDGKLYCPCGNTFWQLWCPNCQKVLQFETDKDAFYCFNCNMSFKLSG